MKNNLEELETLRSMTVWNEITEYQPNEVYGFVLGEYVFGWFSHLEPMFYVRHEDQKHIITLSFEDFLNAQPIEIQKQLLFHLDLFVKKEKEDE